MTAANHKPLAATAAPAASTHVHLNSSFSERGVVPTPSFRLSRPAGSTSNIEFTIRAHRLEDGQWIAEPGWVCRAGSIPVDILPLHRGSARFASRSEAVDDAMGRGLRMIRSQTHRLSPTPEWRESVEALRSWMSDAIRDVRASDETLPLRGVTVMDLFSGGQGGFSMGLASLGANVELACEIDPEAMRVYEQNVRPLRMHDDICSLDCSRTKVDIVTMGLICQAFSAAGKGLGFADPKLASVYAHAMRVLAEVDAKVVVIECARQFLTLDGGRHSDQLIEVMLAAGYRVQHRALDAASFGVPQSRERSVIVCSRVDLGADALLGFLFPEEKAPSSCVADIMDSGLPATIADVEITLTAAEPTRRVAKRARVGFIDGKNCQGYRIYGSQGLGATMTASGGGRAKFTGAYKVKGGARPLNAKEASRMQGMPEWSVHHPVTCTPCATRATPSPRLWFASLDEAFPSCCAEIRCLLISATRPALGRPSQT